MSSSEDDSSLSLDGDLSLGDLSDEDLEDLSDVDEGESETKPSATSSKLDRFDPSSYEKGNGYRGQGKVRAERLHTFHTPGSNYVYKIYTIDVSYAYERRFNSLKDEEVRFRPEEMEQLRCKYPGYSPGEGSRSSSSALVCASPEELEAKCGPSSDSWKKLGLGAGKGVGLKHGRTVDTVLSFSQASSSSSSSPPTTTTYSFDFMERYDPDRDTFKGEEVMFSTKGNSMFLEGLDYPRLGIIVEIILHDFMSHHNFYIKFHPNVNFVVGLNGSGKSAILAALRVGLGISARKSQRGERLSDLVRHGASTARVKIRLKNEGFSAYKPSVFGDSIVVERVIKKDSGGSQYNLYSHDDKKIDKAGKKELDRILFNMNMEIDNPCIVMTQETSKSFITNTDDKERYRLFLHGTQLADLYNDYQESQENTRNIEEKLKEKRKVLKEIRNQRVEVDHQLEQVKHLDQLREDLQNVMRDLVWIPVQEKERELDELEKKKKKFEEADVKLNKNLANILKQKEDCQQEYALKKKDYDVALAAGQKIKEAAQKEKDAVKDINRDLSKWDNKIKDKTIRISSKQSYLTRLVKDIENKQEMGKENFQAQVLVREKQISQLEGEKVTLSEEMALFSKDHDQAQMRFEEARERHREIMMEGDRMKKEKKAINNELNTLVNAHGKSARLFGGECDQIFRVIQQNRSRFRKVPLGPIGLHLSLKDMQWGEAVEHVVSDLLSFFIVDNHKDERTLKSLMGPHVRLRLIVQKFREMPYSNLRLHRKTNSPTVYDILECDQPMVLNAIVDQRHIERLVLVNDIEHGKQVLQADPNCEVRTKKGGIRLFVRGGSRTTIRLPALRARLLSGNFEDQISDLKHKLQIVQQRERESEEEVRRSKRGQEDAARAKGELGNRMGKVEMRKNSIDRDIRHLKEAIEEIIRESNPDTSELVENQKRLELEIEELKIEKQKEQEEVLACKEKKVGLDDIFAEAKHKLDQANAVIAPLTQELQDLEDMVRNAAEQERKNLDRKATFDRELKKLYEEVEEMKRDVEESTNKALENAGVRRYPKHTKQQLANTAMALKKTIQRDETEQPSERDLLGKANQLTTYFDDGTKEVREMTRVRMFIDKNLEDRVNNWVLVRHSITKTVSAFFTSYLGQRGFIGKLNFDHAATTLGISIEERAEKDKDAGDTMGKKKKGGGKGGERSLSGLSGGERSYSTVCLLLALWRSLGGSFRAMDEFDVFMDSGNREASLTLLLRHCKAQRRQQYLFITPDKKQIPSNSAMVTTHELKQPRSTQGVLGFASSQPQ